MKVTKDNTYQIKEHIEVNFKSKSHGIYRDIPLVNDVKREDGSSNRIVARAVSYTHLFHLRLMIGC